MCSEPLLPLERGGLYLLCSGPFIPHEKGGLPSVQWALHPSCERRFTQCAMGPSSLLREEVYPVCSGPPSLLREEVYTYCAVGPSSLLREEVCQCAVGPSSFLREEVDPVWSRPLLPPESAGLPSVRWALRHS